MWSHATKLTQKVAASYSRCSRPFVTLESYHNTPGVRNIITQRLHCVHGNYNRKSYSTDTKDGVRSEAKKTPSRWLSRALFSTIILCPIAGLILYNNPSIIGGHGNHLQPDKFCVYNVASKEQYSLTSTTFTLDNKSANKDDLRGMWEAGIWSVEIKQPELMISRSYTPLPPLTSIDDKDRLVKLERLRFLVRKYHRGEVSGYLHRLPTAALVEVRGPHVEYVIPEDVDCVVFLAGGTGVAPALQAAHLLARRRQNNTSMLLLWANRSPEDAYGSADIATEQSLLHHLEQMRKDASYDFNFKIFVDEEKSFITRDSIKMALSRHKEDRKNSQAGRNLILVSGPDGFVEYVAGAKQLVNGQETQGKIGGLLAQSDLTGWEVWKL